MKIRNRSGIQVPTKLWAQIADAFGLGSVLPQAVGDELGMYGENRFLRVSVGRKVPNGHDRDGNVVGSYTFGHITLYPCTECTGAFLTFIFLHELYHAWLHQYHEALYESLSSCEFCDRVAEAGYRALSGTPALGHRCAEFRFSLDEPQPYLESFREQVDRYLSLSEPELERELRGRRS